MRKFLALALSFGLFVSNAFAGIKPPRGKFERNYEKATFALYVEKDGVNHFTCSATAYEKVKGGYLLVSAGHCIGGRDTWKFSVKEDVDDSLPAMPVTIVKYALTDEYDFSILEFDTKKKYPTIKLGSEEELSIGDSVENVSFALGIAKQFNNGYVATEILKHNDASDSAGRWLLNHYLVEIDGAPGSSGSSIVSKKSHHIVGLLVSGIQGQQVGMGVIPMSQFYSFRADPQYDLKNHKSVSIYSSQSNVGF
jgi:hypothetical protein